MPKRKVELLDGRTWTEHSIALGESLSAELEPAFIGFLGSNHLNCKSLTTTFDR
jgi:hypothetical protein